MLATYLVYFFLLGVIIGSFLNVVILRHNTGKTVGGRSACMTCKSKLTSRELVPLFSFLIQRGRCLHCHARISWQYPMVELATGLLFVSNFYYLYTITGFSFETFVTFILTSSILALFVAIFVYDIKHKIIPDLFSFSAFGVSVMYLLSAYAFQGHLPWTSAQPGLAFLDLAAGLIFYSAIYLLWKLSDGRLIGLGDAKLLLTIGTVLGFVYGLSAVFVSFWLGTAFAVFIMLKGFLGRTSGRITMKSEIAFGPFLIIGFLIVYFLRIDVTNLGLVLNNL
jgi:prepilin signal peptidase PulO-like enzyme (type II secretory pathway)